MLVAPGTQRGFRSEPRFGPVHLDKFADLPGPCFPPRKEGSECRQRKASPQPEGTHPQVSSRSPGEHAGRGARAAGKTVQRGKVQPGQGPVGQTAEAPELAEGNSCPPRG